MTKILIFKFLRNCANIKIDILNQILPNESYHNLTMPTFTWTVHAFLRRLTLKNVCFNLKTMEK